MRAMAHLHAAHAGVFERFTELTVQPTPPHPFVEAVHAASVRQTAAL